jgi:hypothetical protein
LKNPEKTLQCRFLISTAYNKTMIDKSVPSEFFWDEKDQIPFLDASGATHSYPAVLVKRIEIAGMVRDGVAAARADLKVAGGRDLDELVDGILGMSFLAGTRFVYDPTGKQIHWWQSPFPGATLPLTYANNLTPLTYLSVGKTQVPALVAIGRMGGLDLPGSLMPSGTGELVHSQAMVGGAVQGRRMEIDRVAAGPAAWTQVQACFHDGVEWGAIGQDVWSVAPVCFDFIEHRLTLRLVEGHRLPVQPMGRYTLPVLWDRTGKSPRLVVEAVKPGSPMEKAGCQPGDELIRAGGLSGGGLNRRSLMALMAQEQPHVWTVRRGDRLERLALLGAAATQGGVERPATQ